MANGQIGSGGGGGTVDSVVAGDGIGVDSTDPANPVVSTTGIPGVTNETQNSPVQPPVDGQNVFYYQFNTSPGIAVDAGDYSGAPHNLTTGSQGSLTLEESTLAAWFQQQITGGAAATDRLYKSTNNVAATVLDDNGWSFYLNFLAPAKAEIPNEGDCIVFFSRVSAGADPLMFIGVYREGADMKLGVGLWAQDFSSTAFYGVAISESADHQVAVTVPANGLKFTLTVDGGAPVDDPTNNASIFALWVATDTVEVGGSSYDWGGNRFGGTSRSLGTGAIDQVLMRLGIDSPVMEFDASFTGGDSPYPDPYLDFSQAVLFDAYSVGNSGTSKTLAYYNGAYQRCTLTGDCTFILLSPPATKGGRITLDLTVDGTGGYSQPVFTGVKWAGGSAPTFGVAANDINRIILDWNGVNWVGSAVADAS